MKYRSLIPSVALVTALFFIASPALADDNDEQGSDAEQTTSSSSLEVLEAKTAADVDDREPVDVSDSFSVGDRVTVWMAVKNQQDPANLDVVWLFDGTELHSFDIEIGTSPRWRTWASSAVSRAGDWSVELRDSNGSTLETVTFSVAE